MTPKRKFYKKGFQHVFQISVDRGIIFYNDADIIVFFTILCCYSIRYHVRIVSLCIMKNHFHILGDFGSLENMGLFINALCSIYARIYNERYHRRGKLFQKSFGSAPKYDESDIYDCIIYICNNPVPKKAAEHAVEYRWNFLSYMGSRFPFSKAFIYALAPETIRKRCLEIEKTHGMGKYIDYDMFDRMVQGLDDEQYKQMLDTIVSVYNVIDYRVMSSKWQSVETVSGLLDNVKGKEYDVAEDGSHEDYRDYDRMNDIARKSGFNLSRVRFDSTDVDARLISRVRNSFILEFNPPTMELDKYFHTGDYARRFPPETP